MYIPDRWVVINVYHNDEILNKVFAGWYGGYLTGDSWRTNSGIVKVEDLDNYYLFHGESGSIYKCFKKCYGLSNYMYSILEYWKNYHKIEIDQKYETPEI